VKTVDERGRRVRREVRPNSCVVLKTEFR
jgi:hypothetical protein